MKKNLMALGLSAAMLASAAVPAFADHATDGCLSTDDVVANHVGADGNSVETVEYYDEIENANGQYGASVYAVIGSVYKVTIPKVIVLQGVPKGTSTATYYVDVDGDIAGDKKVVVAPQASFAMKQAGKADVNAAVAQAKSEFLASNIDTSVVTLGASQVALNADDTDAAADKNSEASGTVSADLTAGKWAGTFNFNISLEDLN